MTETSLKAVFMFDEQTSAFSPAGHNFSADKAVERVSELEGQGKKARILDQPSRHRPLTFKHCKACTTAAQNLSQSSPGQVLPEEGYRSEEATTACDTES